LHICYMFVICLLSFRYVLLRIMNAKLY